MQITSIELLARDDLIDGHSLHTRFVYPRRNTAAGFRGAPPSGSRTHKPHAISMLIKTAPTSHRTAVTPWPIRN